MTAQFNAGDKVFNHGRGVGTVTGQWGVWRACKQCYAPFRDHGPSCECPEAADYFLLVSGTGIFDVAFDDSRLEIPINACWLLPAGAVAGGSEVALA